MGEVKKEKKRTFMKEPLKEKLRSSQGGQNLMERRERGETCCQGGVLLEIQRTG